MFQCHRTTEDSAALVVLSGKLNALTAPDLRNVLEELSDQKNTNTLLDLTQLELIDSSGIGGLVSLIKRCRANGCEVKIAGVQGQPKEIFKLLNLHQAFSMYDTKADALKAFQS